MFQRWRPSIINVAVAALLGTAAYTVFGRTLTAPFIYDDFISVVHNSTLRQLWPLSVPLQPPRENPFSARPLVNLSAAVNFYVGQLQPKGYREFNLSVHVASAMLLFWIIRRALLLDRLRDTFAVGGVISPTLLALGIALMWTIHPLNTEAVCYVTQRTELMMAFFYLSTLLCSLNYWQANGPSRRVAWLILAIDTCLAGMTCKEVMVSAPLMVLLFDRTFLSGTFRDALRRSWPLYFGLGLTWCPLVYLVAQRARSASAGFGAGAPAIAWWMTQCKVVMMYLRLAFWPSPLSIHYDIPLLPGTTSAWMWLLPVALLAGATIVAVWRRWPVGFLGAWFFMILAPTSFIPIVTEVAAERRMYLPLAAVLTLTVLFVYCVVDHLMVRQKANEEPPVARWILALSMVILISAASLALAGLSIRRLDVYRDPVVLWRDALQQYPDSDVAHANLGFVLMQAGADGDALQELFQAVAINPASFEAHANLGVLLNRKDRFPEAAKHFSDAVRLVPSDAGYHNNFGYTLLRLRQYREAVEQFKLALELEPTMRDAGFNLGLALLAIGENERAAAQFEQLLAGNPQDADSECCLGNALLAMGKREQAAAHLEATVRINPELADAWNNLGSLRLNLGQTSDAIVDLERAVQLKPDSLAAHFNLAQAYKVAGRRADALEQARKSLGLARGAGQNDTAAQIAALLLKLEADANANQSDAEHPAQDR